MSLCDELRDRRRHYPYVMAGVTRSRARCKCGWKGPRRWGWSARATRQACADFQAHIDELVAAWVATRTGRHGSL